LCNVKSEGGTTSKKSITHLGPIFHLLCLAINIATVFCFEAHTEHDIALGDAEAELQGIHMMVTQSHACATQ